MVMRYREMILSRSGCEDEHITEESSLSQGPFAPLDTAAMESFMALDRTAMGSIAPLDTTAMEPSVLQFQPRVAPVAGVVMYPTPTPTPNPNPNPNPNLEVILPLIEHQNGCDAFAVNNFGASLTLTLFEQLRCIPNP